MVKTGGINVAPAEIEGLFAYEEIDEIYVTGMPTAVWTKRRRSSSVRTNHRPKRPRAFGREALAAKVPRHYRFVLKTCRCRKATELRRNRLADFLMAKPFVVVRFFSRKTATPSSK